MPKATSLVAAEVLARLTDKDYEVKQLFPGVWQCRRKRKAQCEICHQYIVKGEQEIQIIKNTNYGNYSHFHYHPKCFWKKVIEILPYRFYSVDEGEDEGDSVDARNRDDADAPEFQDQDGTTPTWSG